jgi:hypothetical protein
VSPTSGSIAAAIKERQRLYLIDVGSDAPRAIQIAADDPADFDALVTSATPIIESMHFK